MSIRDTARKLRIAANALDALLEEPATPAKARQVAKAIAGKRGPYKKRAKHLHWTQRPENAERVAQWKADRQKRGGN